MAKQSDAIKLAKLAAKEKDKDRVFALANSVIRSPMAQVMGTVAITEILEKEKILSGRWAGAIEGSVLTMILLQALKEYGVLGAGILGGSTIIGAGTQGNFEALKDMALNAIAPGLGLIL